MSTPVQPDEPEFVPPPIYQAPPKEAEVSLVDSLAADAKAVDPATPPEYPPGAPKFWPLMKSPYDVRADAIEHYNKLQAFMKLDPELPKRINAERPEGEELAPADQTATYRMLALMEKFLRSVAVDENTYDAWDDRFDATLFLQAWGAYQAGAQPGEASSSSS